MKSFHVLLPIAVALLALSCQKGGNDPLEPDVTPPVEEPKDTVVREPVPNALPIELRLAGKVATDNAFSLDLFKQTLAESKDANVFLSPLSVSMALSMALNGAAGTTAEEMLTALRAEGYSIDEINAYCQELREALVAVDPLTQIAIANSIWYRDKGFAVKAPFINVNQSYFNAEVIAADFDSPNTVKEINGWCARNTNNKIEKIINQVASSAMMYLINAVYFKGTWVTPFNKDDTRNSMFNAESGVKEPVKMMAITEEFPYAAAADAAWIALPYGNQAFEMIVGLPGDGETPESVAGRLNSRSWSELTGSMTPASVRLSLPRFKAECEYDLREAILPAMGMTTPFTDAANFSGISETPLLISKVIHKTFVEVNEEGAEAAAVTAVGMDTTAFPSEPPVVFNVNKPFIFAIRERSTGAILFIGKMGEVKLIED